MLGTKTCGLSDDYSCEVDVTCLVKKQCDGLRECSVNVDDSLFSDDLCPGLSNYLYFEYQCADTVKPYKEPCGTYGDKYMILSIVILFKITSLKYCVQYKIIYLFIYLFYFAILDIQINRKHTHKTTQYSTTDIRYICTRTNY